MNTKILALIALPVVLAAALSGCQTRARSSGKASLSQTRKAASWTREVSWSVDGSGTMVANGENFTLGFPEGKIFIAKGRVLLNDQELAGLPQDAKKVDVDYTRGTLTISADGAKVYEATLRK